jgi:hypothetical protein
VKTRERTDAGSLQNMVGQLKETGDMGRCLRCGLDAIAIPHHDNPR